MKIWVSVDKNGFLDGYSMTDQSEMIEVVVEHEPLDFTNWKMIGTQLVHDPANAPVIEEVPSELEQLKQENEELRQRADITDEALLEIADMVLDVSDSLKGGV